MSKLYQRVREARKLVDLSQEELAGELEVSRSAVAQWEMTRGTAPSVENLIALARRSGMAFEYLTTGRGPKVQGAPILAVAEEKRRKALKDVVLNEAAHIVADEVDLLRADTKLAAQVLPRGATAPSKDAVN